MSSFEPNHICPDCKTKLSSSGFKCKKCGNKKEYDNTLTKMFGIGG